MDEWIYSWKDTWMDAWIDGRMLQDMDGCGWLWMDVDGCM